MEDVGRVGTVLGLALLGTWQGLDSIQSQVAGSGGSKQQIRSTPWSLPAVASKLFFIHIPNEHLLFLLYARLCEARRSL